MLQIGQSYTTVLQTSKAHNKTEGTNQGQVMKKIPPSKILCKSTNEYKALYVEYPEI